MFDISPNEISELNDAALRELVGRLCEAELVRRGLSPAAVTWGGSQTAPDGGVDVRVALPLGSSIDGFVPRPSTGFQVKKPDMPRTSILAEMRPSGVVRPIIQELVNRGGAYVIVSSSGSTADRALRNRRDALREALGGIVNAQRIHTDFYDRTRLATWVRGYPGLIAWVKEKIGRAFVGWRPYGPWSGGPESVDAEYLLDRKLRLRFVGRRDALAQPDGQAIDELRDHLAQERNIVRLVGLSGVGKTRFVQALFDSRVGSRPLPPALAVYTNLSDDPNPQPTSLASDLIANQHRAVLIVDNCPPELHRRLSELCTGKHSMLSVLTVEYDVRDDQPEGTQVVVLESSSPELIEQLVQRRFPHVSRVDARTIAEASGGNAKIANALAETVKGSDSITGLSNDELFQRLFRQRHDSSDALILAAQACSLVYSFQGEALSGEEAELPRLAALVEQTASEIYRHVGELMRRELAQPRGEWRAILPQAIANRLAARALENMPYAAINQQLLQGGGERLARSFSRRLSYLHDQPAAVAIVRKWLSADGRLGDVTAFNGLDREMFENIAPVLPDGALEALERAEDVNLAVAVEAWLQHVYLLRSLAYEPALFERSVRLLARTATQSTDEGMTHEATEVFGSLFSIRLSGTHATIDQRLCVVDGLLRSDEPRMRDLGLQGLEKLLDGPDFDVIWPYSFGARSRDCGYRPRSADEVAQWYGATFAWIERFALEEGVLKFELRDLLPSRFWVLWGPAHTRDPFERVFRRFAAEGFWREGWIFCRHVAIQYRDQMPPETASRLAALEADLRPSNLEERVRGIVLGSNVLVTGLDALSLEDDPDSPERMEEIARELGASVAADDDAFSELIPDIVRGGTKAWAFGCGLADRCPNPRTAWSRLVEGVARTPPEERDVQVLRGFLAQLWERDKELAQALLDSAVDESALQGLLPVLQSDVVLDERGVERLKRALKTEQNSVGIYRNLASGRVTQKADGALLKDLLLTIADQPDGVDAAIEILYRWLSSDHQEELDSEAPLLEFGRELFHRAFSGTSNLPDDHLMAGVARAALKGEDAFPLAADVARRLMQAVAAREIYWINCRDFLKALCELQPKAVLDAIFIDNMEHRELVLAFESFGRYGANPADVIPQEALLDWCEEDRNQRYLLAASLITFARIHWRAPYAPPAWSEQAKALLASAPDPVAVLKVLIERIRTGVDSPESRAERIESDARLLDCLEPQVRSVVGSVVAETKAELLNEAERERARERERDRASNERFE